jgi:ABC-type amino acid transport substrate-binding protein
VRLEIEAALTRNVLVIPILVDGASMPDADQLPPSLAKLVRRQALELSPDRFEFDTGRLLKVLDKTLAEAATYPRGITVPVVDQPPITAPPITAPPITAPPPAPVPRKVGGAATATRRFQPRRRLRAWWLVAAALLAVLLLVAIVLRPQPSVAVPDPGGASVDAVVALLQQDGLVAVVTREANEKVAPGKLLRMAPSAGTKVRRGAAVTLFVSSGPTVTTLPPDRRELTVGFVDRFASSEDNPENYLQGLDPLLFTDPKTRQLQGLDVDLAKALGDKLGVELKFQRLEHFTHSFNDVRQGRLSMSVLRDLQRHQKEEGVDFVDYLDNGTILLVPKDNPAAIQSPDDLCGKTIVRPIETAAGSILADSDRCPKRDQPRIVLMTCPTLPGTQNPERESA